MKKTLIAGGLVYDGTGAPPVQADILVENGRIAAVGQGLYAQGVGGSESDIHAERIDATGQIITPGFIDMHRHADLAPLRDEDFGMLELSQGITATVVGNCGIAPVPMSPAFRGEYSAFIEPVTGIAAPCHAFEEYHAYFSALEKARPAIHMGVMAGTGAVRVAVKGFANNPYTVSEMKKAQTYVAQAMGEGALGVSLGFMYQPECYTSPAEQVQVIAPAAKAERLLTTHIRGEGDSLTASVAEVIGIARAAGIRLHISHFKATGIRNWNRAIYEAIELIEKARATGMQVTADFYPYTGGSTTLFSLIPPTALHGSNSETLRYLATAQGKAKLRAEIAKTHAGWDNMALSIGWDRILIASTKKPEHATFGGRDVQSLAEENGYEEPSDFICDLLVDEGGQVGIVVLSMDGKDVDAVARLPFTAVISDALYGGGSNPHPRLYGSFPRVIRDFVLGRDVLRMEQAIHKMTGMPAAILGLKGRGVVAPGAHADILVFDPRAIRDHAQYTDSRRLSTGIGRVLMGGETVFREGKRLSSHRGQLLRTSNPRG